MVAVHGRRRPRADRVADLQHPVRRLPLVGPQHFAGQFVECKRAFGTVECARTVVFGPVGDKDASPGHCRTGVPGTNRCPPGDRQLIWKLLDDTGLVPDCESVGAAPLRPVVGGDDDGHDRGRHKHGSKVSQRAVWFHGSVSSVDMADLNRADIAAAGGHFRDRHDRVARH